MPGQARILSSKEIFAIQKFLPTAREKALFAVGIYTGMRVGEIVQLQCDQVFTESGGIRSLLKIKRSKQKNTVFSGIPTHPKLKEALSKYQDELENCKWVFPSKDSATGHLTRAQAHNILRKAFDSLELEDASTHSMRRTCLTNMSRAGVPLRTIQEISGHSSLSALQAYLAVDPDDKRRAINLLRY